MKAILLFIGMVCVSMTPCLQAQTVLPLHEAAGRGLVELKIKGRGSSSGDAIVMEVRRNREACEEEDIPIELELSFEPGTVFRCLNPGVQDMVGAALRGLLLTDSEFMPTLQISLPDDEVRRYLVDAYCMDFHKANPGTEDEFRIEAPDPNLAVLMREGKARGARVEVMQAAVWQMRDNVPDATLIARFPVDASMVAQARFLGSTVATAEALPLRVTESISQEEASISLPAYLSAKGFRMLQLTRNTIGHFELSAEFSDGTPIRLIVDTGASNSVLDAGFLKEMGFELRRVESSMMGLSGQSVDVWSVSLPGFRLAGAETGPMMLFATDIGAVIGGLRSVGSNVIHGLIGADLLNRYGAVIDVRSGRLYLHIE